MTECNCYIRVTASGSAAQHAQTCPMYRPMTPREPDRYEAKARDLFRSLVMDETRAVPMIAHALEAEYAEGWNMAEDIRVWCESAGSSPRKPKKERKP